MLSGSLDSVAAALNVYASAIERIQSEVRAISGQRTRLSDEIARNRSRLHQLDAEAGPTVGVPMPPNQRLNYGDSTDAASRRSRLWWQIDEATAGLAGNKRELENQVYARRSADNLCIASMESPTVQGKLWSSTDSAVNTMSLTSLLNRMDGLSAVEIQVMFSRYPQIADRLRQSSEPGIVAAWWKSIGDPEHPLAGSAAQLALIALIPAVLGNLEGIAYWARDTANREAMAGNAVALEKLIADLRENGGGDANQVPATAANLAAAEKALATIRAVERALALRSPQILQLVQFEPGPPALAAISVGDMDRASQITVDVPGMGTTVLSSIESWTMAAGNLADRQQVLNDAFGIGETGFAVVAWIGYHAPLAPPNSLGVMSSRDAEIGGALLRTFLQGASAANSWAAGSNLSVVAHSYGTTVAAIALQSTPVEHFTMLASAGLTLGTRTVADLQVPAGSVWASEAMRDDIADIGRGFGLYLVPDLVGVSEHPINPTESSFGAGTFSSEAKSIDGHEYLGVTSHSAAPRAESIVSGIPSKDRGYLDEGTSSLYYTGLSSMNAGKGR